MSPSSGHQGLADDPHLMERYGKHDEETHRHQEVSSQHREDKEGRHIGDEPRGQEVKHDPAESSPRHGRLQSVAGVGEVDDMDQDHEDDRHRKEMKVRDFSQFPKRHRFAEGRVGPAVVIGDALERQAGHAVSPEKRKRKTGQHQQKKQRIEQPGVAIRIAQFEFLVEVSHVGRTVRFR